MYTFNGSVKSRRKCALSRFLSLCLQPRVLLVLSALFLTSTAILLLYWSGFTHPVTTAERSYGIVVDAGSSSSKVYLFQWPHHDGDPAKLLTIKPLVDELGEPRIKKVEPGIATFSKSPETAFTSIQPLLEFALSHIPASQHQHTVLLIFSTAGMRLLPKEEQSRIVEVLYERVLKEYPFHLPKDGVQVISGKLEGVFSWITINYLLGHLSPEYQHPANSMTPGLESSGNESPPQTIKTVGSLDMGGASLQVTFEVPHDAGVPSESTVDINLGCGLGSTSDSPHKHRVFVSTYLGYGSNEVRTRYLRRLLQEHLEKSNQSSIEAAIHLHSLRDPCSPLDYVENITIDNHSIKIRGLGDFSGCKRALLPLLQNPSSRERGSGSQQTHSPCTEPNCSLIPGFQRPPMSLKYESLDFYGTSEFWYTMRDVLRIGGHYTTYSFEKASSQYCQTNWKVLMDRFLKKLYIYADHYRLKSQCMKSAWLSLVLHEGLGFPKDTISLHSIASMEGQSVQWALGALLYNTRYLPLREVQLHQQLAPPLSEWHVSYPSSSSLRSSFLLPFLMVLCVAILLLCCRQRRPYRSIRNQGGLSPRNSMHRSQSLNSLVKIHRRMSSMAGSALHIVGLDTSVVSPAPEYSRSSSGLASGVSSVGNKLKFMV